MPEINAEMADRSRPAFSYTYRARIIPNIKADLYKIGRKSEDFKRAERLDIIESSTRILEHLRAGRRIRWYRNIYTNTPAYSLDTLVIDLPMLNPNDILFESAEKIYNDYALGAACVLISQMIFEHVYSGVQVYLVEE